MPKNSDCDVEENLYGCYLLYCLNKKFKGHTYIGYTVNPLRRIRQHNNGVRAGGAKRTSNKGPWEMVLIIHGFPNSISALKFEWAWQHPKSSRRLNHVRSKRSRETAFQYRFYIVSEMLQVGPWKRLPLTVRWLKPEYVLDFDPVLRPPSHMPIVYGQVTSHKVSPEGPSQKSPVKAGDPTKATILNARCALCKMRIKNPQNQLRCLNPACSMESHMTCLAERFSGPLAILPVEGTCPGCGCALLWGDLIKHKNGCYKNLSTMDEVGNDDHWTAALHQ